MNIDPEEVIYAITVLDILKALKRRLGAEAQTLSPEEILSACDEIKAAIDHNLDIRDFLDEGLDAWEITRNL